MGRLAILMIAVLTQSTSEPGPAIAGADGTWAILEADRIWICWDRRSTDSCLAPVTFPDGRPRIRRGRFFGPDTLVVASTNSTYLLRRGETTATPLDPREQEGLLALPRVVAPTCSADGWLPVLDASHLRWVFRPCEARASISCPTQQRPKLRRPTPLQANLVLQIRADRRHIGIASQQTFTFVVSVDLGFAPKVGLVASLARLRQRPSVKQFALHTTVPQLQALEVSALRAAVCPSHPKDN